MANAPVKPLDPEARTLSRGRIVLARVLTVIGVLLAVVSLLAVFVRWEVLDDSTFRETSEELLQSEPIQQEIASRAVEALYENVDVAAELEGRLPAAQQGLAGPLAVALRSLADRLAVELIGRPRSQQLLVEAMSVSHDRLVLLLEDEGRFTSTEGGVVYLELRELVGELASRIGLPVAVVNSIPSTAARIKLLESGQVETAQKVTHWLDLLASWLWVFVLIAWAIAIWLVPGRRRKEVRAIAIGLLVVGVLVLLIRRAAGSYLVDELASPTSESAAQDAYDIVTRHLRDAGWTDIMVGVVALVGVWLVGPSKRAREALGWLAPHLRRPEIVYGAFAAVWILLLWWRPTVQFGRPLNILVMLVVSAIGVEVLRRVALARHPDALPPPDPVPPPPSPT